MYIAPSCLCRELCFTCIYFVLVYFTGFFFLSSALELQTVNKHSRETDPYLSFTWAQHPPGNLIPSGFPLAQPRLCKPSAFPSCQGRLSSSIAEGSTAGTRPGMQHSQWPRQWFAFLRNGRACITASFFLIAAAWRWAEIFRNGLQAFIHFSVKASWETFPYITTF